MELLVGIDTGGTFTDTVVVAPSPHGDRVLATAKAPTTHGDLPQGIGESIRRAAERLGSDWRPESVALVALSTTLATNALVEGHGQPVAVLSLGFDSNELTRAGVEGTVDVGAIAVLGGGHDAHGNELEPFPHERVAAAIERLDPAASAFAVIGQFSVRNAAHERQAAEMVRTITGKPVTASHELTARLGGPRRALTAVLNARLLATIAALNRAVLGELEAVGVDAPLMVVRGDGSLVSADFAAERPIETILSGPAASIVGAAHLSGVNQGVVADIGGTTTDVAVVSTGRPVIGGRGAVVGGHATLVEAVDVTTVGLGGDSEVRIDGRHPDGPVVLGPERAVPIGRLCVDYPEVLDELRRQAEMLESRSGHGRFVVAVHRPQSTAEDGPGDNLSGAEARVLERVRNRPLSETEAAPGATDRLALTRLRRAGLVRISTLTPTDAAAIADRLAASDIAGSGLRLDREGAGLAATVLARSQGPDGRPVAVDGDALARRVLDLVVELSARFATRCALVADGVTQDSGAVDSDALLEAGLRHHRGIAEVRIALSDPLVSIGAPAPLFYPEVAARLHTRAVIPEHAEVANAVGAVVGRVRIRRSCTITQPTKGQFRVHLDDQPTFGSVDKARSVATDMLKQAVSAQAQMAGGDTITTSTGWEQKVAAVGGKEVFVEGTVTVEASGRPRLDGPSATSSGPRNGQR